MGSDLWLLINSQLVLAHVNQTRLPLLVSVFLVKQQKKVQIQK